MLSSAMDSRQNELAQSEEDPFYKKTQELQVRRQINFEQRQRAMTEIQASNEALMSLQQELSGKIQDVEENRIRLSLGVSTRKVDKTARMSPTQKAVDISNEIRSVRRSYLHRGGRDPEILSRIAELEREAARYSHGDVSGNDVNLRTVTEQLAAIQMENAKITAELVELRSNRTEAPLDPVTQPTSLSTRRREYEQQWAELHADLSLLREQVALQRAQHQYDLLQTDRDQAKPKPQPQPERQSRGSKAYNDVKQASHPVTKPVMNYLPSGPYDPRSGFVIFYDAVIGLDPSVESCGLAASLYSEHQVFGEPGFVPTVLCHPAPTDSNLKDEKIAVLSTKQAVARCWPSKDISLVVELQVGGAPDTGHQSDIEPTPSVSTLVAKAWCKVPIFDLVQNFNNGWWRLTLHTLPVRAGLSIAEQDMVTQYGQAELLIRLMNQRDSEDQSSIPLNMVELMPMYRRPDMSLQRVVSTTPATPLLSSRRSPSEKVDMCIQVINVKHAPLGEARIRMTAYTTNTGQVVQAKEGPVTINTVSVKKSDFRHQLHVFGRHEATFHDLALTPDLVLVVKLYVVPIEPGASSTHEGTHEGLAGWAAIPLMRTGHTPGGTLTVRLGEGLHRLQLASTSVPDLTRKDLLLSSPNHGSQLWRRNPKSLKTPVATIQIFSPTRRPPCSTPDVLSSDDEEESSTAWHAVDYLGPPTERFKSGDGFDLYIDGCRFLPDGTTVSKVVGRILDREYKKVGQDLSAVAELDSDIYNPVYSFRAEIREQNIPPTATLLLKVYTVDRWSGSMVIVGYATLKIFTLPGTTDQPRFNSATNVALNAGAHQVRLWADGPDGLDPITEDSIKLAGGRHVPCATVLLRLVKVSNGKDGRPLQAIKVPQADWQRLQLMMPIPYYSERRYISSLCKPSPGERQLYADQQQYRHSLSTRDALNIVAPEDKLKALITDKARETYIKKRLIRSLDSPPEPLDLTCVARFSPKHGVKIALDGATNLPWYGFTHATICLNPPAALYHGAMNAKFDQPRYTSMLDRHSESKSPRWGDGFQGFTHRSYHPHLCAVIHLHEITVNNDNGFHFTLMDQAWTVVPVVTGGDLAPGVSSSPEGYAITSAIQAPLYSNQPSSTILSALSTYGISLLWNKDFVKRNKIQLLESASVSVRVSDGRRGEELPYIFDLKDESQVETRMLKDVESYAPKREASPLIKELLPRDKISTEFYDNLASNFKALVSRRYSEGV